MLMLISPAKTLDYSTAPTTERYTQPHFIESAQELVNVLQHYSPAELAKLMKLSDKLAGLNVARFAQWQPDFTLANAKQALLAFKGDVYAGLDANTLNDTELEYAQKHLRILSGLYAVLRPLDLMQPYRLEMGTRLSTAQASNLYNFWGDSITEHLNHYMQEQQQSTLLNLASNEYFKAVKTKLLQANLVTVDFKDLKNGQYKIISFYAKKARGMMARYVIEKQLTSPAQLQSFDRDGYYYCPEQSTTNHLIFLRDHADES